MDGGLTVAHHQRSPPSSSSTGSSLSDDNSNCQSHPSESKKKKGMLQGKKKARTDGRKEKKETAGRYDRGLPGCCHLATARPKPRPLRRRKEAPPTEAPPRHLHSSANQRPPFPQWPRTVRTAVVRRIDRNRKQQFHHHHHC